MFGYYFAVFAHLSSDMSLLFLGSKVMLICRNGKDAVNDGYYTLRGNCLMKKFLTFVMFQLPSGVQFIDRQQLKIASKN